MLGYCELQLFTLAAPLAADRPAPEPAAAHALDGVHGERPDDVWHLVCEGPGLIDASPRRPPERPA